MAKSRRARRRADETEQDVQPGADAEPSVRERVELGLFLVVEVLCLLLFVDFLFLGIYVK
ncbi:MAG: hypothetical protein O2954_16480 [bacterium]|nr:hypothetical protein [bacterium]